MLLAVGYHYIAESAPEKPRAIFPVTTPQLEAQIEALAVTHQLVSRDELVAAVDGDAVLPDRACVLTFDDGLRCQFELALPVLERLSAPAIFFVSGRPLAERRMLEVHKLHALREHLMDDELAARLPQGLPEVSAEEAQTHYRYDTLAAARLKFLLNIRLPADRRRQIVDELFDAEFPDESAVAEELYMDAAQVVELERAHRSVGAHSYAHQPLATLSNGELGDDVARVTQLLEQLTGTRPRAFSYPYGTPEAVDARAAGAVGAAGYHLAFTMRREVNETLAEPLLLGRLDTNDLPR